MLSILPYHHITTRFFQEQSSLWQFFDSHKHKEEQLKEFKTDLLKNTYKFDETAETALYSKVNLAKEKLDLQIPVVLYQAQNTDELNAGIVYLNGEAHIVFSGNMIQLLTEEELLAIIAHELSHVQLYTQLKGAVEVTERIIAAIGNHYGSSAAYYETARLFKLYTEIFCDRGAHLVTGSYAPVITSLVKIATRLQSVNAESYIKQAEEVFASDAGTKAAGISHPENFIRARAIWLWDSKGAEAEPLIRQMIEGHTSIDELDLFKQQHISAATEQLIKYLLRPEWMQTPRTIALGKQYFPALELDETVDKTVFNTNPETMHINVQDYFSYVLYDFATADKELEDVPLGYCFFLAEELKLDKAFANTVRKERKLTEKKTALLKKQALEEFQQQKI